MDRAGRFLPGNRARKFYLAITGPELFSWTLVKEPAASARWSVYGGAQAAPGLPRRDRVREGWSATPPRQDGAKAVRPGRGRIVVDYTPASKRPRPSRPSRRPVHDPGPTSTITPLNHTTPTHIVQLLSTSPFTFAHSLNTPIHLSSLTTIPHTPTQYHATNPQTTPPTRKKLLLQSLPHLPTTPQHQPFPHSLTATPSPHSHTPPTPNSNHT